MKQKIFCKKCSSNEKILDMCFTTWVSSIWNYEKKHWKVLFDQFILVTENGICLKPKCRKSMWTWANISFSSKLKRSKHDNQHAQLTKWPWYFTFLTAIILGDKDVYIDVGSSLNLACNVKQIDCVYPCDPYDPQFIIWMKNNKVSVFM